MAIRLNPTPSELIQRYEAQRTIRRPVESVWNEITRLVYPFKGDMFRDYPNEQSVDWRENRDTYDATATYAANTLSSSIHGSLTSSVVRWFDLRFRDEKHNKVTGALEWLQSTGERMYKVLQDSNFNLEASEMYQEIVGYGSAILVEEDRAEAVGAEGFRGVDFQSIPIREGFFESDSRGQASAFYRRHEWTAVQICTRFPEQSIPETIKRQALSSEGAASKHDVIFCVYPQRYDPSAPEPDITRPILAVRRPIQWRYILYSDKTVLQNGGYYEMPAFVPRWRKMSGSQWGFSPAMIALPDIKTLNSLTEQGLAAGEKAIDPAIFVPERDLYSNLDASAGSINVVRSTSGIVPWPQASDYQQEVSREDRLQRSIREAFHVDELELKESPAMTATEVQARRELMQRLLGPTLGRLQSDFMDPMLTRTYNIMVRAGQFDELPAGLETARLDVIYTGPLALSQSSDRVQSLERWIGTQVQLAEVSPEVLDVIDFDEAARESAKLLGTPATAVRGADKVKVLRQQRQQQEQKAMELAQAEQASKAVKNVGGPAEAQQLAEQVQGARVQ